MEGRLVGVWEEDNEMEDDDEQEKQSVAGGVGRRVKEEDGQEKGFEKEKEEKEEEVEAKGLKDLNPISVEYWQVPDVSSTRRNFLLYLKFVFL